MPNIFLLGEAGLVEMSEQPYDSEKVHRNCWLSIQAFSRATSSFRKSPAAGSS